MGKKKPRLAGLRDNSVSLLYFAGGWARYCRRSIGATAEASGEDLNLMPRQSRNLVLVRLLRLPLCLKRKPSTDHLVDLRAGICEA